MNLYWKKEMDFEALQAFDSEIHEKDREEKILSKLNEYVAGTNFNSVDFPEEDYTQYLRIRTLLAGGSRRLLDSLRVAQDALDEDPGKEMGQLDLTAVIQAILSKKPATDVFVKDEYLSKSFAWSIIFDASASMRVKADFARALAIVVAEATKELLMDPGSWTLFAFSDRFYVLKDSSEAYTQKVRARIGGLRFQGLTYMPDAIRVAGQILAKRYDEQRFLIVISDGWPYGYSNMSEALKESIDTVQKKGIIVLGIGVETEKMGDLFKLSSPVYSQKDLIKRFSKIYTDSSAIALET
jgi:nitric oxide reductase activation protein